VLRFADTQPLMKGAGDDPKVKLSVCTMGPVGAGEKVHWMEVWVWQQRDDGFAVSSGRGGEHLGGKKSPREALPFKPGKGWMIQTALAKGSKQFKVGKPALVMGIARVTRANGEQDVQHWTQGVTIRDLKPSDYY
jgi:hypothetical protein